MSCTKRKGEKVEEEGLFVPRVPIQIRGVGVLVRNKPTVSPEVLKESHVWESPI